jgi:hypothetical protein
METPPCARPDGAAKIRAFFTAATAGCGKKDSSCATRSSEKQVRGVSVFCDGAF